jgi:hypothetical protein
MIKKMQDKKSQTSLCEHSIIEKYSKSPMTQQNADISHWALSKVGLLGGLILMCDYMESTKKGDWYIGIQ